jgi:hypothetical protein
MTAFTILHALVSVLPVGVGLAALVRHGTIDPRTRPGKWYVATMLAGAVSGFGFILTIGFTIGQVLGLFTIALLAVGTLTPRGAWRKSGYTQTVAMSASYLTLWVFLTTETLKRFPTGQPFATGPDDPALLPVRLVLLAVFGFGVAYQVLKIRAANSPAARLERILAEYRRAA